VGSERAAAEEIAMSISLEVEGSVVVGAGVAVAEVGLHPGVVLDTIETLPRR